MHRIIFTARWSDGARRPVLLSVCSALVLLLLLVAMEAEAGLISKPPSNLGLVGYWSFNEGRGSVVGDASGYGSSGEMVNMETTDWVSGKFGTALDFDGTNERVSFPDISALRPANVTVSAWFNADTFSASQAVVTKPYNAAPWTSPFLSWMIRVNNSTTIEMDVGNGTTYSNATFSVSRVTPSLQPATWYHVALTYDGTTLTAYLNGTTTGTNTTVSGNIAYGAFPVLIGADHSASPAGDFFDGKIDEVRIYNRALSAADVSNLYKSGFVRLSSNLSALVSDGLVSRWSFDGPDLTATSALDSGVGANNGTRTGTTKAAIGQIGQGLSLEAAQSYVSVVDDSDLDLSSSFSISAWAFLRDKPPNTNWSGVVTKGDAGEGTGGDHNYLLAFSNNALGGTGFNFTLENSAGTNCDANSGDNENTGQWYHLLVVFDDAADTANLYINGAQEASVSCTITPNTNTQSLIIGDDTDSSGVSFSGIIDEVRIYNKALNTSEVSRVYNLGRGISNAAPSSFKQGLVGHWTFDGKDMVNGLVRDASGNGNNGSMTNMATSTSYVIGRIGQALRFDRGTSTRVAIPDSTSLRPADVTVSAWFKLAGPPAFVSGLNQTIVAKPRQAPSANNDAVSRQSSWIIRVTFPTNILFQVNDSLSNARGGFGSIIPDLQTDTWYHVALSARRIEVAGYLNGVLKLFDSDIDTIGYAAFPVLIGADHGSTTQGVGNAADAIIDDVRVYNRGLSAREVALLYAMGRYKGVDR